MTYECDAINAALAAQLDAVDTELDAVRRSYLRGDELAARVHLDAARAGVRNVAHALRGESAAGNVKPIRKFGLVSKQGMPTGGGVVPGPCGDAAQEAPPDTRSTVGAGPVEAGPRERPRFDFVQTSGGARGGVDEGDFTP